MSRISPFEKYAEHYENWFEKNRPVYEAELRAVKAMIPAGRRGMEIGAGTGRFAGPLGIRDGVEPSAHMRVFAKKRGIRVVDGVAEALPYYDSLFDFVLMVTTVCFVDDISKALMEAYRVLLDNGVLVIGFVDRDSKIGKMYLKRQKESFFYREATFFSTSELIKCISCAGFKDLAFNQTIFGNLDEIDENEPVKSGYGDGSFVVICGRKELKD